MRYDYAPDLQREMERIAIKLFPYINTSRVKCFRSSGSSSRNTIARCHTIGKLMQKAIGIPAYYAIEFLEHFEKLSDEEKTKTIIHELMHIPKAFGGGFRHHDYVCDKNINLHYKKLNENNEEHKQRHDFW
jgi:predicted metallopeptidase